ncbi:hypothetical protein AB3X52_14455 [Nocardioides sp. DS6]|uniref:Uncharacterized protein n=1 Tax=Nocardioides eburneus TaxID=3231482 RepID=A0ABV3T0U5_9ACTN
MSENSFTGPFTPVLHSQSDVEAAWRRLIQPLGWSSRRLWLMLIGADDRPVPRLLEVTEMPDGLDPDAAAQVAHFLDRVLDECLPGGRLALLLCRPGAGFPTAADRSAAGMLYDACRERGVPMEVIHLATDVAIMPLPADSLPASA